MEMIQLIPLLTLLVYILFLSYYIAVPMFCFKAMLFYAHLKYREIDFQFEEHRVKATLSDGEKKMVFEHPVEEGFDSRFYAMTLCSAFRILLADIRKAGKAETE